MKIIKALTLADKQKFAWMLTQMEARGVRSLSDARQVVEEELRLERLARMVENPRRKQRQPQPPPVPCPKCGAKLYEGGENDSDFPEDQGLIRVGCKKCGYSRIVEEDK